MKELTKEELLNLCVTALEGGIGYWACLRNDLPLFEACREKFKSLPISEVVLERLYEDDGKGVVIFEDAESEDEKPEIWRLTLKKLKKGVKIFEEQYGSLSKRMDENNFDADDADKIFQYALFGELVFA